MTLLHKSYVVDEDMINGEITYFMDDNESSAISIVNNDFVLESG